MSLSGNVTPKEKTDAKSTPVAHAFSALKRTVVPLDHKQVKTRKFHFGSRYVTKQPEHDPAEEKKAAAELIKRRAAVEFMNFIYEDDNSYRNPQQQMLFIRTLIDEPDYAEQILRTKASNERCNLAGLEEQLQTIIRKKSTSNKDAQNTQRKNHIETKSSNNSVTPDAAKKTQQNSGKDLKSPMAILHH